MSKITTVYDNLSTFLATLFPTHQEHVNPYALELNDQHTLEKGYSFILGPGENTNELSDGTKSIQREVVINLSLRVFGAKEDIAIRKAAEKQLLEDQYSIIESIEEDPTLEPSLELIQFIGDNGVEMLFGEEASFIALKSTFNIRYYEQ
jgi:hypothetical protein